MPVCALLSDQLPMPVLDSVRQIAIHQFKRRLVMSRVIERPRAARRPAAKARSKKVKAKT
jgi:ribulose bisphosphate carboxylase small subunit